MRIQFDEDREVRDHLGVVVQSFRAGEVVELSTASARRWIRRSAAREVADDTALGIHETIPEVRVIVHPREPEEKPTTAFEEHRRKELGESREPGPDQPSSASPPDQASASGTATESGEPETTDAVEQSSSTEPTSDASGPTASTAPTQAGGGRRRTRRGSKG